ncbi:4'-phosphopantetheinyl transferase superfamily protein [Streptomyces sp. TRM43335]|uniref:4'-phosphopantetheinyl transferase superfamily protein n=2 Tax=Streptomyces taklimakanensis TaxID=2569853 RepID=A0A6G2BJX2_9ACTN|nr:4'-phosphopantetheinyl transferase superfamily protein [Streptomyces taklimakanensis]
MKSARAANEFIACRAAVRRILSEFLQVPPGSMTIGRNPCPKCGSEQHGPPAVRRPATDRWISISHTAGIGLLAVSPFPVGVDVEAVREVRVEELVDATATPAERRALFAEPPGTARGMAFLRCWTRKEAVLKATGVGIGSDLSRLESRFWAPGPGDVTTTVTGSPTTWRVDALPVPDGWVAALALPHDAAREIIVRRH